MVAKCHKLKSPPPPLCQPNNTVFWSKCQYGCGALSLSSALRSDERKIISVIIPIYNAGPYLSKLLDSVVNQFVDNVGLINKFEVILSLDDPTDGSDLEALNYATRYPDLFKVIRHKNVGLIENRNIGMRAASGIYLMWADHDDEFVNKAFEDIIKVIENEEPDIINFQMEYIDRSGKVKGSGCCLPAGNISPMEYSIALKGDWWMLWTNVFKNEIIRKYNIYPSRYWLCEDVDLRVKAYFHSEKISVIRKPLYRWRLLGESTSHNSTAPIKYFNSGLFYLIHHLNYSLKQNQFNKKYWNRVLCNTAKTNFVIASKMSYGQLKCFSRKHRIFLKAYLKNYGIPVSKDSWRIIISILLLPKAAIIWNTFLKLNSYKTKVFRQIKLL